MFRPVAAGLGQVPLSGWSPVAARPVRLARPSHRARRMGQPVFAGRVEVKDLETEAFIAGADVSLLGPGEKLILTKQTDEGGNAAFLGPETAGKIAPETQARDLAYKVEASGYEAQAAPFVDREIVTVYLQAAPGFLGVPTVVWALGGVGLIVLAVL